MTDITILIDDTPSENLMLKHEHGLSFAFSLNNRNYLLDTGLSGKAFENATYLGIDINNINTLILSHGHIDHTGGLSTFATLNSKAKIYASKHITEWDYVSNRHGITHSLSPVKKVLEELKPRLTLIDKDIIIDNNLHLVFNHHNKFLKPQGNKYLHIKSLNTEYTTYNAEDEISVAITESDTLHILSSCSHNGILNIISSCQDATGIKKIGTYIGGLHLLDEVTNEEDIISLIQTIKQNYPELMLYTGHCTGNMAKIKLHEHFAPNVNFFQTGSSITL
ncbi:MAG: MBL fold metallo-hydrolase [Prevotellaceae bacterium]|nr:MBL fold metallo-hydrolase [Candidatus Faecinaster equi]